MIRYPEQWRTLRTVLSHDWLLGMRGGERVLELLADGFPEAPICTLVHRPGSVSSCIESHRILTSPLQHLPGVHGYYRNLLPFFPLAETAIRAPEADLVISTSHCAAKGLRPPRGARHLCYCFTPMRYAWTFYEEYFGRNPLKKALLRPILRRLRAWDLDNSSRVDRFVTLSHHVRDRIQRFYGRDADVVYPPVNLDFYTPAPEGGQGGFDLVVSALVPYKRVDLAVRAYTKLGRPLKVVGTGTETAALRRLAGPTVEFLGWRGDHAVRELYRSCRMLLFPGEEDFGIVPLEAMACGRPVVAYGRGGATETVVDGTTGIFFPEQTEDALIAAVRQAERQTWDAKAIRVQAEKFSPQSFIDGLARIVDEMI